MTIMKVCSLVFKFLELAFAMINVFLLIFWELVLATKISFLGGQCLRPEKVTPSLSDLGINEEKSF